MAILNKGLIADAFELNLERGLSRAQSINTIAQRTGKTPTRIRQIVRQAQNAPEPNILERARENVGKELSEKDTVISDGDEILEISNDVEAYGNGIQTFVDSMINAQPTSPDIAKIINEDFWEMHDSFEPPTVHKVDLPVLGSEDFEINLLEKKKLPKDKRFKLTGSKVELFATDIHFPFENKIAWEIFLDIVETIQPDIIWLGGDNIDGYAVSQWDKDPQKAHDWNIQYEFDYCRAKLAEIRQTAPNAKIYYKEGNHETRLQRFLNKHAPALRSLKSLTIPFNLDLAKHEIEWVENNDKYRIGDLFHFHGNEIGGGGANIALSKLRRLMSNCIFGHYHTAQSALLRKYDGTPVGAWSIGAMCDFQQDYVHFADTWTNEIARIEYLPSGLFHVQPSQFIADGDKMICRVDGHWFEKEIKCNT